MAEQDIKFEAEKILSLTENNMLRSLELLERQLNALYTRAQVLMTLCGVVITVTGFSGRKIADTSLIAQLSIIFGLLIVLTSAIWIWRKVMNVKWITASLEGDPTDILCSIIQRRNNKTKAYTQGGIILCAGFMVYCIAIAQMLLFSK